MTTNAKTTLHILGRDGADTCCLSECGTPGCSDPRHMMRTIKLRLEHGDESAEGTALLVRDDVNGGWEPMGDSLDSWLSSKIIDLAVRIGVLDLVVKVARDWTVRRMGQEPTLLQEGGS